MKFKDFLVEMEEAEMATPTASYNKEVINDQLSDAFDNPIMSPEAGIRAVSMILSGHGMDVPAIYGLDPEGDEVVIDLHPDCHLYMIYSDNDNGLYDFHAEVVDDEGLEEILEDEDDEEE